MQGKGWINPGGAPFGTPSTFPVMVFYLGGVDGSFPFHLLPPGQVGKESPRLWRGDSFYQKGSPL